MNTATQYRDTTKDMVVEDKLNDSKLKISEIIDESSGENFVAMRAIDLSGNNEYIEVCLTQDSVVDLMEKLNRWLLISK